MFGQNAITTPLPPRFLACTPMLSCDSKNGGNAGKSAKTRAGAALFWSSAYVFVIRITCTLSGQSAVIYCLYYERNGQRTQVYIF